MTDRTWPRLLDDPRAVTVAVAALVCAGLWLATWQSMGAMDAMPTVPTGAAMSMPAPDTAGAPPAAHGAPPAFSADAIASGAAMWLLMMAAMMLPSMAPMLAVYAGIAAKEDRGGALAVRIALFALGYFVFWALFSLGAALGQIGLARTAYFTMGGTLATPVAAGILLLIAGGYQFTGLKHRCVVHCRHPLAFLLSHWREGMAGAFPVGARHGLYCFGCCIALMGLMFVFGTMNVLWMALIALYFLAEKVLPHERVWGRMFGAVLVAAGAVLVVQEIVQEV